MAPLLAAIKQPAANDGVSLKSWQPVPLFNQGEALESAYSQIHQKESAGRWPVAGERPWHYGDDHSTSLLSSSTHWWVSTIKIPPVCPTVDRREISGYFLKFVDK